jgi:hypothetical protein
VQKIAEDRRTCVGVSHAICHEISFSNQPPLNLDTFTVIVSALKVAIAFSGHNPSLIMQLR